MACKLVLGPSFPILQREMLERVRADSQIEPMGPRWIVVPTSTVAAHLRIALGRQSRSSALLGTRIIPLPVLISCLPAERTTLPGGRWTALHDLLLQEVLNRLTPESPLAPLLSQPPASRRLRPTFLDLADAGFGVEHIPLLEELGSESDLAPVEREILMVYSGWLQMLTAAEVPWEPLSSQTLPMWIEAVSTRQLYASLSAEEQQHPRLFVYGFYEFTDVNLQLIVSLSKRLDLTLFFPFAKIGTETHPAFSFAESTLLDLTLRLGPTLQSTEPLELPEEGASPLRFFLNTFPEGKETAQPAFLSFQKASGIRAEVISAALRIRRWLDADALKPHEMMMLAPRVEVYLDAVEEIFAAFAIPFCAVDVPVDSTPDARSIRMLERLWEDQAPVEWLLACLREFPSLATRRHIDLEHFEGILRSLPVWGGQGWQNLARLGAEPSFEAMLGLRTEELELIREIIEFWLDQNRPEELSLLQAQKVIGTLQGRWLENPSILQDLASALEQARQLVPEASLPAGMLFQMVRDCVEIPMQSDRLEESGVVVAPLMRARGLTAKAVVVLGLASGRIPFQVEEDPFLSDLSRRRLMRKAGQAGHRLPVKSLATEEMTLLFFLLNCSAERIHWVVPETDEAGKSVSPTPWVQKFIQRWGGAPASHDTFQHRIPRSPSDQAHFLYRLDPSEGSYLPPESLRLLQPNSDTLLPNEFSGPGANPSGTRKPDPHWYGLIPSAALKPGGPIDRVSVTGLENLARCPYRFYAQNIARWNVLSLNAFHPGLDALRWGSLLHGLLEAAFRPFVSQELSLTSVAKRLLESDSERFQTAFSTLRSELRVLLEVLPPLFREALKARLSGKLESYLRLLRDEGNFTRLLALEKRLRKQLPGSDWLKVSGVIDRIESGEKGKKVVDYKSAVSPWSKNRKSADREVTAGYRMQPYLYPWLAQDPADPVLPSFAYLFFGRDAVREEEISPGPAEAIRLLEPLVEILQRGLFFWTSTESLNECGETTLQPCTYCDYMSLCRRFEPENARQSLAYLRKTAPQRLRALIEENAAEREAPLD